MHAQPSPSERYLALLAMPQLLALTATCSGACMVTPTARRPACASAATGAAAAAAASRGPAGACTATACHRPGSGSVATSRRLQLLPAHAEKSGGSSTGGGRWEVTLSLRTPEGREEVLTYELEVRWNCCLQGFWAMRFCFQVTKQGITLVPLQP